MISKPVSSRTAWSTVKICLKNKHTNKNPKTMFSVRHGSLYLYSALFRLRQEDCCELEASLELCSEAQNKQTNTKTKPKTKTKPNQLTVETVSDVVFFQCH